VKLYDGKLDCGRLACSQAAALVGGIQAKHVKSKRERKRSLATLHGDVLSRESIA
jgi:hypothetical protein